MARISGDPSAWHILPADLAAELGWTVAAFGHLEDMLKRTIFALDRDRLSGGIRDHDFRHWLTRMDAVAADSLGTLIERLERALARAERPDPGLIGTLEGVKEARNLLCHAVWRPDGDGWVPVFASTRGDVFDDALGIPDLRGIRARTLDCARRLARIIHDVGDGNGWAAGD